jgi:hypothetical protein
MAAPPQWRRFSAVSGGETRSQLAEFFARFRKAQD